MVPVRTFGLLLLAAAPLRAEPEPTRLPEAKPEALGVSGERLARIDEAVQAGIARGNCPGAVVLVLHQGHIVYRKAFGLRAKQPEAIPNGTDTVYDLASLTKPLATATSILILLEQGKLRLSDPVLRHWPAFTGKGKERITIEHLLLHTAGLPAVMDVGDFSAGRDRALERICQLEPAAAPGERFRYSDIGYIVLGELIQRLSGQPLEIFAQKNVFDSLGMKETGFLPAEPLRRRCAPTEQQAGRWLQGVVHDPRARALGGVAGHAGLFGTADDLAVYAQMLLDGGRYGGRRLLSPLTVQAMTTPRPVPGGWRALGWDVDTSYSSNRGQLFSRTGGFGHTGFTGTSLWLDPPSRTAVIFLSNRVHPDGKANVTALRGQVATLAAAALGPVKAGTTGRPGVLTGLDVLVREEFARLAGRKVGLVTNHTGRDREGRSVIDLLHKAPGVELVALFSPEHGLRGAVDEKVADGRDATTGLSVYSLYGPRTRPTAEMLKGIDTLVYDIQDAGCRFYTYISTLGHLLESAREQGIKVVVLDRPNPLGGQAVEGPVLDAGRESFVAYHPLPIRHGMTVGELARLFNAERKLGCDLEVVRLEGWRRGDLFDATGLTWVNPSPNLRNLAAALVYPGVGLLETTNVSVGRGTDRPFEWIGAPWLDGRKLAEVLAAEGLPGVRFVPARLTPASSTFQGKDCGGVQIFVDDWRRFQSLRTGLLLACTLRRLYPDAWQVERYDRLLGHKATLEALKRGAGWGELEKGWQADLRAFQERRRAHLLYPE
jgi:uncharacterized protein YbbC (DUF1343 family)/CubicO group peptidase (beta-lactamase class C family)